MVLAIFDGRKWQTRRPIKPQPVGNFIYFSSVNPAYACFEQSPSVRCPFGQVGDRLWVKETFRLFNAWEECCCYDMCQCARNNGKPVYYADTPDDEYKWKPSIHMPRWASRITLEITDIRVERVRDISATEAANEGVSSNNIGEYTCYIDTFRTLWDSIYAKHGLGWDDNPQVWVIEFRRIEG